ncbi:hypothetical protein D3C84_1064510 [compost metagenome]
MQGDQGAVEVLRQLQRFCAQQSRRQHGKFATADPCNKVQRFGVFGALAGQLLADRYQQIIGVLTAQTLIQPGEVLDP